jgi:glycosyltransferase involved in cell wall biosynthesis
LITNGRRWNIYLEGLVSIIIPVVRNDVHLAGCLKAIEENCFSKNIEIIVVDEGLERSAQRNIGMDRARGEYYLFLDSDMEISPYMIEDCLYKIQGCAGVYIPERIITKGWFGRLRDWERQFYNGTLVDVVRFVRADKCPHFDESLHGVEDSSWERQLRKNNPNAIFTINNRPVYHHDKINFIKYLKKKWYYAASLSLYKKKNPNDRLLTFKYRCWQVFIENEKWKRLIKRPDLAIQVFILLFIRGLIARIQEVRNP